MRIVVTSCIAALTGFVSPMQAADLDQILYGSELPVTQTVEIGSGWYLRGDLGYQVSTEYRSTTTGGANPFQNLVPFTPSGFLSDKNDFSKMTASIGA